MQWANWVAKNRTRPNTGNWHEWKQSIADECGGVCVYCAISEARYGGIRNFHVEHFRPKSKFPDLEHSIENLYVACSICNVLKNDDWPAEPAQDHSVAAYPDPATTNYNDLFYYSTQHEVVSETVAGKYVIEKIFLNRAQLVLERRLSAALQACREFEGWVKRSSARMTERELRAALTLVLELAGSNLDALQARPYRDEDTKRPPQARARRRRLQQ